MEATKGQTNSVFESLHAELSRLRDELNAAEAKSSDSLKLVHPSYRASAINLVHYLVTRQVDLRPMQLELWRHGFSSLGRIEGHVRDAVEQVIARVGDALARSGLVCPAASGLAAPALLSDDGDRLLRLHTQALLGSKPARRHVYVMVTAPDAAEVDDEWMASLLDAGMNVLRINGAHETVAEWQHIVETARRVAAARRATLRVLVDLPGPKLRTVAPWAGPRVQRWKPQRDAFGRVTTPCHVVLGPASAAIEPCGGPCLTVPNEVWAELAVGDELILRDARGRKRRLEVVDRAESEALATLERTAYVVPETVVRVKRRGRLIAEFPVRRVEAQPFRLALSEGDLFRLRTRPSELGAKPGMLPELICSETQPVLALRVGARVLFDDGKLECAVEAEEQDSVILRVVHAPDGRFRLGAEKGINFPGTPLVGPTLGPDDERALAFAIASADIVGASFVRGPDDVRTLYARLDELGARQLGVILKIETAASFAKLPAILLAGMSRYPFGVMIARGDLAVEAGFERLAELQEEILWLCEAAHVPAIWATQVLDQMARTGTATRAEVTDAAMSVRAECVMLNKGPHVDEAVKTLIDILERMEDHQYKKRSLYRRLNLEVPEFVRP
ncbi:MAG TPA: pyruvate kinase [Polyangiaceae bacterium]|jgi:pyruvate kinase|nr:pyruvate kinase [Polyangiaceae bacterium]